MAKADVGKGDLHMVVEQVGRPEPQVQEVERVSRPGVKLSWIRLTQRRAAQDVFSWLALLSFLVWVSHSHAVRNAVQSAQRLLAKFLLHG